MGSGSSTRVAYTYGFMAGKATSKWEQKRYPQLIVEGQECEAVKQAAKVRDRQIRREEKERNKFHENQLKAEKVRCGQEVLVISKSSKAARAALAAAMVANEEMNVAELLVKQAEWKRSIEIKEKQCADRIATLEANHAATIKEKEEQYKATQETLNRLRISELKQATDTHAKSVQIFKAEHASAMAAKDQRHAALIKAKEEAHSKGLSEHDKMQLDAHKKREDAHAEAISDAMRHANKRANEKHDEAMTRKEREHEATVEAMKKEHGDVQQKHEAAVEQQNKEHEAAMEESNKKHEDALMNYQLYSAARNSFSATAGEDVLAAEGAVDPQSEVQEEAISPMGEEGKRRKLEPVPLIAATPDKPS